MDRDKIHNLKSELVKEKPQFDSTLGGEEKLETRKINYEEFAESRMLEIAAMTQAIEEPQHTSLIFQEIPRHMRRRVMGHTTKRLPRILREAHHNQLLKGNLLQVKKPIRKHKRKSRCLLEEFNRRQREFVWLETHLWHAKRFHMIEKWGYKIANFPNDKSFRACYRASSQHCLLQDVSYLCCIELTGPLGHLLDGLKCFTQPECGLTFGAKVYLTGSREGNVTLFSRGMFPFGAIGNVNFLWKPLEDKSKQDSETEVRTLWMWVHPALYPDVMEDLVRIFELKMKEDVSDETVPMDVSESSKSTSKDVEKIKLATRNVPYIRAPKYESDKGIQMVLLKDTLNRLRLTGPLSQAVLAEALCIPKRKRKSVEAETSKIVITKEETKSITTKASDIDEIFARMSVPVVKPGPSREVEPQQSSDEEMEMAEAKEHDWWTDFYKTNIFYKSVLSSQEEFWQLVKEKQSPAELPPHLVIGLTVIDPRVNMPLKRKKSVPDDKYLGNQPYQSGVLTPPPHACASAIWSSAVRDIVSQTKVSVAELNLRRSKNLVPGFTEEELEEASSSSEHSHIPILLIQRPGCRDSEGGRIGFGSGWDIVVPAGWAMPLWMALIFRGARPSGQRESSALRREMLDVDILLPDSRAGRRENDAVREELTEEYFRLPPAKRPNFLKLGISSPFSCAWDTLTREWTFHTVRMPASCSRGECYTMPGFGPFFILRNKAKLLELKNAVEPRKDRCRGEEVTVVPQDHRNCLVPVSVVMVRRGTPENFSLICTPSEEDLKRLADDACYFGPEETQHEDKNAEERKKLRQEHKALLKRLRRQHKKLKKKLENTVNAVIPSKRLNKALDRKRSDPLNKEIVDEYKERTRHLWLPECTPVKDVCSKLTIGFIAQGAFTFTKGCGAGVGYVPFPALVDLMAKQRQRESRQPLYVLIRSTTTYQYRFATLQIVCPS